MTTTEMKALYEANPESWIVIWKFSHFEDDYHNQWTDMRDDYSDGRFRVDHRAEYKLINIKHKQVLEAYLADNSVEIEYWDYEIHTDPYWYGIDYFIENYNPDLEYRLKEKEDEMRDRENNSIYSEFGDGDDNNVDIDTLPLNSFQDYNPTRIEVIGKDGREFTKRLDNAYYDISIQDDGRTIKLFEKEIKKEWYEYPENFPALITNTHMFVTVNSKEEWLAEDGITWRLATKAEMLSLYVEEDDESM